MPVGLLTAPKEEAGLVVPAADRSLFWSCICFTPPIGRFVMLAGLVLDDASCEVHGRLTSRASCRRSSSLSESSGRAVEAAAKAVLRPLAEEPPAWQDLMSVGEIATDKRLDGGLMDNALSVRPGLSSANSSAMVSALEADRRSTGLVIVDLRSRNVGERRDFINAFSFEEGVCRDPEDSSAASLDSGSGSFGKKAAGFTSR
mmetsp:Transcript_19408/g.34588  ORF Transcript_19408/g.34588 Transcript_19408/m.34588 type:complete len:202 (-) Transcript_19408:488-1093(-)